VVFSSGGAAAAASFPPRLAESAATEPLPLPRPSSPSQAERDAIAACYLVRDVASALWPPVPGRSKDYIARPKPNGYASLHLTVRPFGGAEAAVVDLRGGGKDDSIGGGEEEDGSDGSGFETGSGYVTDGSVEASSASEEGPALELQIRTARMHASAEFGEVRLKVFPFFFLSGGGAEVLRGKPPKGSKKKTHSLAPALFFRFFSQTGGSHGLQGRARQRARRCPRGLDRGRGSQRCQRLERLLLRGRRRRRGRREPSSAPSFLFLFFFRFSAPVFLCFIFLFLLFSSVFPSVD